MNEGLNTSNVDDYIEQMEQQQDSEDARYLRDLHYLYRKEEILTHARQRLIPASDLNSNRSVEADAAWLERSTIFSQPQQSERRRGFAWPKLVAALAAALLLLSALFGTAQFFKGQTAQPGRPHGTTPMLVTPTAPSAPAVLFSDPLRQNVNNWIVDKQHFFKDGAYYIRNQTNNSSVTILQHIPFAPPWSYSLDMTQLQGNTTSAANSFGLVFAYTHTDTNHVRFYTFELTRNSSGGRLAVFVYDNSQIYPWQELWSSEISKNLVQVFHSQPGQANTLKVTATTNSLTLMVNDRAVGTMINHTKIGTGQFGMLVNLQGSEIAFQNMLITRP